MTATLDPAASTQAEGASSPAAVPPPPPRWHHVPSLDGLRGLAVLLVVAYHAWPSRLPGGFVGVDVFFVLSGFLITALLLRERAERGRVRLRAFWTRRVRRLVPALLVVLVVASALTLVVGRDTGAGLRSQVLGALTWTSNWVQIHAGWDYTDQHLPPLFNHLWSLGIEEQFYVLWPIVVVAALALTRRRVLQAAAAVLAVGSAVAMGAWYLAGDGNHAYMGLDSHAFGLLLGAAIAFGTLPRAMTDRPGPFNAERTTMLGMVGLVALLAFAAFVPWNSDVTFLGGLALANVAAALVLVAAVRPTAVATLLCVAPLRWLGERSYGLYLWHWPLIVFAVRLAPAEDVDTATGAAVLLAVVAAAASYRLVETPMRRHGIGATLRAWATGLRGERARRYRMVALAGVTVTVFAGAAVAQAPQQSEVETTLQAGQEVVVDSVEDLEPAPEPPAVPPAESPADPARACAEVAPDAPVSAFGDSVTVAVAPALVARRPGTAAVAAVGWQYTDVAHAIRQASAAGQLQSAVVIATGTNGVINRGDLEALLTNELLGRQVALVVPSIPGRYWADETMRTVREVAAAHDHVHLVDWQAVAGAQPDVTAADNVHPSEHGQNVFADLVASSLQTC